MKYFVISDISEYFNISDISTAKLIELILWVIMEN